MLCHSFHLIYNNYYFSKYFHVQIFFIYHYSILFYFYFIHFFYCPRSRLLGTMKKWIIKIWIIYILNKEGNLNFTIIINNCNIYCQKYLYNYFYQLFYNKFKECFSPILLLLLANIIIISILYITVQKFGALQFFFSLKINLYFYLENIYSYIEQSYCFQHIIRDVS